MALVSGARACDGLEVDAPGTGDADSGRALVVDGEAAEGAEVADSIELVEEALSRLPRDDTLRQILPRPRCTSL